MSGLLPIRGAWRLLLACAAASATLTACQPRTADPSDEVGAFLGFTHGMTKHEAFSYLCKGSPDVQYRNANFSNGNTSENSASITNDVLCNSFAQASKFEVWSFSVVGGKCGGYYEGLGVTFRNDRIVKIEHGCQPFQVRR
jgi:hypothetical protein